MTSCLIRFNKPYGVLSQFTPEGKWQGLKDYIDLPGVYVAGRLDRQTAEDIVSETFLTAFTRRHRFDPDRGSLRPWLFGIATNLVNRHRRKEARRYRTLSRVPPEPAAEGPENRVLDAVAAGRLQPRLARALTRLSAGERDVLLLVALAGLSYEEVAEALGI